ncbi:hypothetical protein OIV83_005539 [Microbotryomycetes sp. JL201]|nr:hypothetical protein OIV83_005539 [Microbotryomycetes sp. JL201]
MSVASRQEALLEFAALGADQGCPAGIYLTPSDPFAWSGVHFVHRGFFAGAVLHFTVDIPRDYPHSAPTVVYRSTALVHPLVDPATGKLRLDSRFPTWRPRQDFIVHVLHFMKACFKRHALDALTEAHYRDRFEVFVQLASQSALLSTTENALYDTQNSNDKHGSDYPPPIAFRPLKEGEEQALRQQLEAAVVSRGRARTE